MKTIYIKEKGYDTYFKARFSVRTSIKGYRIAHLEEKDEISRHAYYSAPVSSRCIRLGAGLDRDIHEIGNAAFMAQLEAQEDCDA
nr:MAG TPA: hypothetical protein [Caudoviricetes sp.]